MAPGRQDLHAVRRHKRDPAPGHLPGARQELSGHEPAQAGARARARRVAGAESRRGRLTDSALHLFAARGYSVTSVDDIVKRAKVSKSAFYESFSSKEVCFRAVLAQEGGELMHHVLTRAAAGHNHHERLRLGISTFVEACFERPAVARLLIVESVGLSDGVEAVRRELQARFAGAVAEEVRHARAHDPFYARLDPSVFGRAVIGAVSDSVGYFLTHPGADATSLAEGLCAVFAP